MKERYILRCMIGNKLAEKAEASSWEQLVDLQHQYDDMMKAKGYRRVGYVRSRFGALHKTVITATYILD